ncbi:MAG: NAD(P)-dependent oxidoreductase [Cyanobacteria bacterium NC_groundwater_1444_Ag_S-0.65um_54_12]|nr:NAD(P)-dependent oxidoreductase [Cyanobacteria bacterium NC_groundwater_1444_Ag_S-0.65um_54_12]
MKVMVTGAAGFIGGYLVEELLSAGYEVIGIDNFSKYGERNARSLRNSRYQLLCQDAKDSALLKELLIDCDQLVAGAAMIGGISYFHDLAFDLLAENERIMASTFDAAINAHKYGNLQKITVLSSSMVYGGATVVPFAEGDELLNPPPRSAYGFQKLAVEYYAKAAYDQHGLPYTIVRPFNCVGIGETRAVASRQISSGDLKIALGHVVPDLIQKVLRGQNPLRILGSGDQVRTFTYGGDMARGIRLCMEHPAALNEDFNLSSAQALTICDVARLIWQKLHGARKPFVYVSEEPFPHDVPIRIPAVEKAKRLLGFEAATPLTEVLDELIPWIQKQMLVGAL